MAVGLQVFNEQGMEVVATDLENYAFDHKFAGAFDPGTSGEFAGGAEHLDFTFLAVGSNSAITYRFRPTRLLARPSHGAGLEVFNEQGVCMFSSLLAPLVVVRRLTGSLGNYPQVSVPRGRRYAALRLGARYSLVPSGVLYTPDDSFGDEYGYNLTVRHTGWGMEGDVLRMYRATTILPERRYSAEPPLHENTDEYMDVLVADVTGL